MVDFPNFDIKKNQTYKNGKLVSSTKVITTGNQSSTYIEEENTRPSLSGGFGRVITSVLLIFVVSILLVNFYRTANGIPVVSFESFLNWLGTVKAFPLQIKISDFAIGGDWGLFDGFRVFLDTIAKMTGFGVYLSANAVNIVYFLGQILSFLFIGG